MKALLVEIRNTDEIFTWQSPESGRMYSFDISAIRRAIDDGLPINRIITNIQPEWIDRYRRERGIEQPKLDRLCDPWLHEPALGIAMSDGTVLCIDGHHRCVKLWESGEREQRFFILDVSLASAFIIDINEARQRALLNS